MADREESGRQQRAKAAAAAIHAPNLTRYYRYHLPPLVPGEFIFDLALLRPRQPPVPLGGLVDALSWDDEENVLTGSITVHRPDPDDPNSLPITRGQLLRCRVRWDGGTYGLWTMRTAAPEITREDGTVQVTLQDDLARLKRGKRDWIFRSTHARPHGYNAREITRLVAHRLGLKLGELAPASKRFSLTKRDSTAYAVLTSAWAKERDASGRHFILRLRNGRLEVVTIRRNPLVYALSEQIQSAVITQKAGTQLPITVLTGTGKIGKGHNARKVSHTERDRKVVKLLGYAHDTRDYGTVSSHADLRRQVKRDLAKGLKLNDKITVQHQGIPFILRGDGARIWLPSEGYGGADSWVYATRANHTVQSGVYTTTWEFVQHDPFLAEAKAQAKRVAAKR